jgi:hypothetical protein
MAWSVKIPVDIQPHVSASDFNKAEEFHLSSFRNMTSVQLMRMFCKEDRCEQEYWLILPVERQLTR